MKPGTDVIGGCGFDRQTLLFQGRALAQAACLLRTVRTGGTVDSMVAELPDSLRMLIDQPMVDWSAPLRRWLADQRIPEQDIGGPLDAPVSGALLADGSEVSVRYFVIHDTSQPWLDSQSFPPDEDARMNDLGLYAQPAMAVAHVFVNRLGRTFTAHGFDEPWRATKLEVRAIGLPAKGLFLHIELIQPRRRDPVGQAGNDALAPTPGFTAAQYDALALLYMAASVRAGVGLIPGYHAAVDDGQVDAHDDPQHFDLAAFGAALARLVARLSESPPPAH
jgi:hypothetical protein